MPSLALLAQRAGITPLDMLGVSQDYKLARRGEKSLRGLQ